MRKSGRTILTEYESKQLLAAYGIPTVETAIAVTERRSGARRRTRSAIPIVLKLYSLDHHAQDRRGRRAAEPARCGRRRQTAFQAIQQSVTEKAGAEHFQGVTVQPMVEA